MRIKYFIILSTITLLLSCSDNSNELDYSKNKEYSCSDLPFYTLFKQSYNESEEIIITYDSMDSATLAELNRQDSLRKDSLQRYTDSLWHSRDTVCFRNNRVDLLFGYPCVPYTIVSDRKGDTLFLDVDYNKNLVATCMCTDDVAVEVDDSDLDVLYIVVNNFRKGIHYVYCKN